MSRANEKLIGMPELYREAFHAYARFSQSIVVQKIELNERKGQMI